MHASSLIADFLHEMARAASSVALLTVPQTNEVDLIRSKALRGFKHPKVISFVWIHIRPRRSAFDGQHMQSGARLCNGKSVVPVGVSEVDGFFEKRCLVEEDVKLELGRALNRRLGEEKIACAALLEMATQLRVLDDAEELNEFFKQVKHPPLGEVIQADGTRTDMHFRDMTNKVTHGTQFEWWLGTDDQKSSSIQMSPVAGRTPK